MRNAQTTVLDQAKRGTGTALTPKEISSANDVISASEPSTVVRSPLHRSLALSALLLGACAGLSACGGEAPGADLNGQWTTGCVQGYSGYTETVLQYTDLALVGTYTEYSDASCAEAYHVSKWTGTATVGEQLASGPWKLDLAFTTFTSTALTADNAATNNSYAYCGFTDWEAGVEMDVLGADCYGFSIPEGGKSLDIYQVDGDTLLFGTNASIGTDLTEADRPTALDESRVFTRVEGS